ncbi:MAG: gluconokinase [bacterium]|nr:gluconokinase [bacterium]
MSSKTTYVVMGVTGCGKSTIGRLLGKKLEVPFFDGDDYHPDANVQKMSSGIPLIDEDRFPWLKILNSEISKWNSNNGATLACSALKEDYRKIISNDENVQFIYLNSSKELIKRRLSSRQNHFMPSSLIDSQFDTLEEPEDAIWVDASLSEQEIVDFIFNKIVAK